MPENNIRYSGVTTLEPLVDFASVDVSIGEVTFQPKAQTFWHSHESGQLLCVVAGRGLYQERGLQIRILAPGDRIVVTPGVEHWHGATSQTPMTHIAITAGPITWLDEVDPAVLLNAPS